MMMKLHYLLVLPLFCSISCAEFLNEKPSKSLAVPDKLEDLEALLDARAFFNFTTPDLPEVLADNYYATATSWASAQEAGRINYVWAENGTTENAWVNIYQYPVYYANVVLDQLATIALSPGEEERRDRIRGSALFYRAFAFFTAAQLYCRPYSDRASTDLGIPLRTTSDIEVKSVRATVKQTYERIIGDLQEAVDLLPERRVVPTQPAKVAAHALLARCCLAMRDYGQAGEHADLALAIQSDLMDYNDIPVSNGPFRRFNAETILYNFAGTSANVLYTSRGKIDSTLYRSYPDDDLRKVLFFQPNTGADAGTYRFRGCYDGDYYPNGIFDGLTTGELYLVRAECRARAGEVQVAMADLNHLLRHRMDSATPYEALVAATAADALALVLAERRKELVYRNQRWTDLRRFNEEGKNITLTRILDDETYTLPPNDPRWVLPIPDVVIGRSGMQQNER